MSREEPVAVARKLVRERFPDAVQAWLGGSAANGGATPTSDLDITVLLEVAEVHRESLIFRGWPVELFVHDDRSIRHFVDKDLARRRPTMARLVAASVPLLPGNGGADLHAHCSKVLAAGPGPLAPDDLDLARYYLTDLIDDLRGGGSATVTSAVAVEVWQRTAELLLASGERWTGGGKWLARELGALDEAVGTHHASRLQEALYQAIAGDTATLVKLAQETLNLVGGSLWSGFRMDASLPSS